MRRRLAIVLGILAAGCGVTTCGAKPAGLECASAGECRAGHACVAGEDMRTRCMLPCTAGTFFCDDGSLCTDTGTADGFVCWYGGRTSQHSPCEVSRECEAGTHCVDTTEGRTCEQACVVADGLPCRPGVEACIASPATPTLGWCQRIAPGADAGGAGELDAGPPDAQGP